MDRDANTVLYVDKPQLYTIDLIVKVWFNRAELGFTKVCTSWCALALALVNFRNKAYGSTIMAGLMELLLKALGGA